MDYILTLTEAAYPQEYPKELGSSELVQTDLVPLSLAIKMIEDIQSRSITWSVDDFQSRAEDIEGEDWRKVYDEDAFEDALIDMINSHDCNHGITWETIDSYLHTHCKK
jgi:hypothetical protein